MIEIASLTESDVGRPVIYLVEGGVERKARLLSWLPDRIILGLYVPEEKHYRPVEVDPTDVKWLRSSTVKDTGEAKSNVK